MFGSVNGIPFRTIIQSDVKHTALEYLIINRTTPIIFCYNARIQAITCNIIPVSRYSRVNVNIR